MLAADKRRTTAWIFFDDKPGDESVQYRKFGKLAWQVSALGFGAMRLPVIGSDQSKINDPEAIRIIRHAIDHGVNYLDTAYPYHAGQSERVVGLSLKGGYRDKVKLATKLPANRVETASDFDRFFKEQLSRLQTDKIDFYLLHGLNAKTWPKVRDLGVLGWAESQIARGRIGHLGFSFHDGYDVFKGIIDDYGGWTFCQVLYNYMDTDYQAGRRGIEYAAAKDLGVIVMEPLRGGKLAQNPPEKVAAVWESAPEKRRPVAWGLLWVWNQPEISLALSGMSAMEQVVENLEIAGRSGVGILDAADLEVIARVREAYKGLAPVPCTGCRYCLPCPSGTQIPIVLNIYNDAVMYHDHQRARVRYQGKGPFGLTPAQRGDNCTECGECTKDCPQKIPVADWLKKIRAALS